MEKKAIVFDNSGTLLERYRVIKNLKNGEFITHINSLTLIDKLDHAALVVLQFNTGCLAKLNPSMKIYDLIHKHKINFNVSYSTHNITDDVVLSILKNDPATISDITDGFDLLKEKVKYMELCNGSAVILDVKNNRIGYTITSAGKLFPNVKPVIDILQKRGNEIFIASGDRAGAIQKLTEIIGIDKSHGFYTASPLGKKEIIQSLKGHGFKVMMVGDGPNDVLAFKEADIAVLTTEQSEDVSDEMFEVADYVIKDIVEVSNIKF